MNLRPVSSAQTKVRIHSLGHPEVQMSYKLSEDHNHKRENSNSVHRIKSRGDIRTILKFEGKFTHGTRGKPGRSSHGDRFY